MTRCRLLAAGGCGGASVIAGSPAGWAVGLPTGWAVELPTGGAMGSPQKKSAYGTGPSPGGGGCLAQCDSIHRTRGSGPGGDTGSTNTRT